MSAPRHRRRLPSSRRAALRLVLVVLAVCALPAVCCADAVNGLTISHDGVIESYGENRLLVSAPAAGRLTVTVSDDFSIFRTLWQDVPAGESVIIWDGLRDDGQRLGIYNGSYTLDAALLCPDGRAFSARIHAEGRTRQALLYVLPCSDTLYTDGERWFAEAGAVKSGEVVMTVAAAQSPDEILLTRKYALSEKGVGQLSWGGTIQDRPADAGRYLLRYRAVEDRSNVISLEIAVVNGAPPVVPVTPTGPVMPAPDADDADIWALLQKPRVVVNIPNTRKQKIHEHPDSSSRVLGTLSGQTQGVEVEAIEGRWARIHAWQHEDVLPVTGYVPLSKLKTVAPNGPYGLVIDKAAQTLTLYENGARIATVPVSTGLATARAPARETAPGAFLTDEHIGTFTSDGSNYAWPIRYDGDNFLHQLGYRVLERHADYSIQRRQLGSKASHGCVRLPERPDDGGFLDAFWLWTHLPRHTPLLILDDR